MSCKARRFNIRPSFRAEGRKKRELGRFCGGSTNIDKAFPDDKALPELEDKARECLALNSYLNQLDHPQVAFDVKQRQRDTLDKAVTATLEMESYITTKMIPTQVGNIDASEDITVAVVSPQDKLITLIEKLLE